VTDNLIEIEGLRYTRGNRIIFDDLSLVVPRGQITALMGPSGTGKTAAAEAVAVAVDRDLWVVDLSVANRGRLSTAGSQPRAVDSGHLRLEWARDRDEHEGEEGRDRAAKALRRRDRNRWRRQNRTRRSRARRR